MKTKMRKPEWWINAPCPAPLRRRLEATFSPTRDGWAKWYRGKSRFVCGRLTPPQQIEDVWQRKRALIDAELGFVEPVSVAGDITLRDAAAAYLTHRLEDVESGRIAERTYHNLKTEINRFIDFIGGEKGLDTIRPEHFAAYRQSFKGWSHSGIDSVVTRIGQFFRWCVEMDYLAKFKPGPAWRRPAKHEIRDQRISKTFSFTAEEVATLYSAATQPMRTFIALGVCCAFNNSDIGNLTWNVIDLDAGVIDYRRRKSGKVRRVIPLPPDVLDMLKQQPVKGELVFVTEAGNPYTRTKSRDGSWKPSDAISTLFGRLLDSTNVARLPGRGFKGLRTTFRNLAPRSGYDLEIKVIMGHAKGTIDLDHYLESVDLERLRFVVEHVWSAINEAMPEHPA